MYQFKVPREQFPIWGMNGARFSNFGTLQSSEFMFFTDFPIRLNNIMTTSKLFERWQLILLFNHVELVAHNLLSWQIHVWEFPQNPLTNKSTGYYPVPFLKVVFNIKWCPVGTLSPPRFQVFSSIMAPLLRTTPTEVIKCEEVKLVPTWSFLLSFSFWYRKILSRLLKVKYIQ